MNSNSRRGFWFILWIAVVAVGTFAIFPGALAAQDQIVIRQWYHQYGEAGTEDAVLRYADEYMAQNPGVKIEVNWIAGDYGARLNTAMAVPEEAPDVYETQVNRDAAAAGWYADLSDLYTDDIRADFGPAHMAQVSIGGVPYGIKMIDDTWVIYYLKSQFEAAGLSAPTTFDELISVAQALTTDDQAGLFLGNSGMFDARQLMRAAGGTMITDDNKLGFDADMLVTAFTKMKELYDSGVLLTGAPTDWWDPGVFLDGLAAMQLSGLWAMPAILDAYGDDVGVFPIPAIGDNGSPVAVIGGWSQVVNPNSPNVEAAKAYIRWLWIENADIQADWATSYGFHIPPRASTAAAAEKLQTSPALDVVQIVQQYGLPEDHELWNGAMSTALGDARDAIVVGGADPMEAANTAVATAQAELDATLGQ